MVSISDNAQATYSQNLLASIRDQLNTTQNQVSSGRQADTFAGLGGSATYSSLSLRSQANQLTTFSSNIDAVTTVTTAMDAAMSSITSAGRSVSASLQAATQSNDPGMNVFGTQAQGALSSLQSFLNTNVAGRYVFGGTATQTPPIADTAALNNYVSADTSAYAAGTKTADQVLSDLNTTGTNATATSTVAAGAVTGLAITAGGSLYTSPPTITLSGGGGTGATATAILKNGIVTGYTITSAGTGYTSAPTVSIAPSPALATATSAVTAGAVTGLTITNGGAGYTYPPTITLSGGGGTGATAIANVTNGVITGYTITNAGTGYTSPPTVSIATGMVDSNLGYASGLATAGQTTVRSNTNVDTDYTVKANDPGYQNMLKGLSLIANLKYNPNDSTGFYKMYNAAISLINTGASAVDQLQGKLGVATKSLQTTQTSLTASQTTFTTLIGGAENADIAAASTRLQSLETQLQASYSIIAQVKDLSLINYLK